MPLNEPQTSKLSQKGYKRSEDRLLSGREDLNLRPLAPHASALAGLRHAPSGQDYSALQLFWQACLSVIVKAGYNRGYVLGKDNAWFSIDHRDSQLCSTIPGGYPGRSVCISDSSKDDHASPKAFDNAFTFTDFNPHTDDNANPRASIPDVLAAASPPPGGATYDHW